MTAMPKDYIWDEMAKARDLKVTSVTADENSVTYRVSFDLVIDRSMQQMMFDKAGKKGRRVASLIAAYARSGLKMFFRDDDAPEPNAEKIAA